MVCWRIELQPAIYAGTVNRELLIVEMRISTGSVSREILSIIFERVTQLLQGTESLLL